MSAATAPSVVLITGCSSGFGLLSAITFAREGHRVFASVRNVAGEQAVRAAAADAGVAVEVVELDVCDAASVDAAVAAVVEAAGSLDVVVNNAGIELFGAVHLVSDDEVRRQLDTNVMGVVRVVRAVVPHMCAKGSGVIVNVGSVAGRVGVPYSGLYAASKHAVEALSEAMHFELSQHGIRVAVVEPGQFATELAAKSTTAAAMGEDTPEHARWQAFRAAMRQLVHGDPADPQRVADVILEAATTDAPRLRWPVGDDAVLVIDTKAAMPFEEFESTMRIALDWHD
jgi:NAD(P)-dependent dehydrogenase (short-subunit alcohol dehydrogenase family)